MTGRGRGRHGPDRGGRRPQWGGRGPGRGPGQARGHGRGPGRGQGPPRGGGGGARGGRSGRGHTPYRPPQLPSNPSDVQFIRSALRTCPNHKLKETIEQLEKSWVSSWRGIDNLPKDAVKLLLSAVARLPFSASIPPPPLPACSKGVTALLSQAGQAGEALDGNDETLEAVELVERFVKRLMKFTWDLRKDDVKDALDEMVVEADSHLNPRLKEHRPVRGRLTTLLSELEKPWIIKVKTHEAADVEEITGQADWRHPTVGWLTEYKHFQPALLPKLQLPRTNEGRVYHNSQEYFDTIVKLWIGMTFVEGNNALLPHCSVKMGDKVCDQPLWPYSGKDGLVVCRNPQCDRRATFLCAHRMHSKGYCSGCADKLQQLLRGPPSTRASTHIYDGTIASVKYDGTVSIESFQSRRPPLKPIHWRTTKRLSSPNLVGIVLLANREASLRPDDEIYWCEVSFQGKSFDEFKARERGRLTLRLLEYLDEPGNPFLTRNANPGDAVAIIDCQTFVPEFIPVLKALEKQQRMPVPFQDGALLNLSNEGASFPEDHESEEEEGDASPTDVAGKSTADLIRTVVRFSLLDPIIDIRRDGALRDQLERSLVALVNSATLDPGQLKSFMEALMYPVHCTQGPPGTGKSYLGVVVVRALLVVRDLWMKKNREVGEPPILVLSYKNHAIDEFLLDLVHAEPSLHHNPRAYFGRYYLNQNSFRKLVRIGGSCSEPELEQYRERNVAHADPSVVAVSKQIEDCQKLRDKWHEFRDCFSPIFEAQAALSGTSDAETTKALRGAVPAMSTAVATILRLVTSQPSNLFEDALGAALSKIFKPLVFPESDEEEETKDEADSEEGSSSDDDLPTSKAAKVSLAVVNEVLKKKPMLANADFNGLFAGIRHYDPAIDPQEVLYQWISGFCPLPACHYSDEDCLHICMDGSLFCEAHSCTFFHGEAACLDAVVRKRQFCERHLCCAEKCKNSRVAEGQRYCEDHACFVCLERDEAAGLATDDPPRNACERHPLCWGLDGMCTEVAETDASYCKVHAEELYCKWKGEDGTPCREIASTGQYCGRHHAAMMVAQAATKGTGKCQGKNKKGKPCGSKPSPGSAFCKAHMSQAAHLEPQLPVFPSPAQSEVKPKQDGQDQVDAGSNQSEEKLDLPDIDTVVASTTSTDTAADNTVEIWDSDSEGEEFVDAVTTYDNEDEVEESEHLQHLREVYEVNDDDDEEEPEESIEEEKEEAPWGASSERALVLPHEWNWDMTLEERWSAVFSVLDLWGALNSQLKETFQQAIADLKVELHREVLRANARVYEGKAVIGGTITGCVARLEAIRTTNPFAILVEEASEVMEPLLFSCFSSSTRKLEMIGDHMQLQPSVMGRIDFERLNKINISMFERLICAPQGNEVPASVLSIQRRMRKSICDLTRKFYVDITAIEDHEVCGTKVIAGDKADKSVSTVPLLTACEGEGREVPGVLPHVFFWTHTGAEQRASVGLSRENPLEANMACKLVQYLVHCGVPAASIAVLTPYKGQLMLMRKLLMNKYGLQMMTKGRDPRPAPQCTVSTVDRFQGDEADIVIISLVIDGKSRTPFVKLQNRMIVLLSRARLGMYIVGNKEYFGETPHWQKTLGLLEREAELDNDAALACASYSGVCIGPALPICCPGHRESVTSAKKDTDLKLGFCTVVCSTELPCSHECGLNCHWPNVNAHNQQCSVEVESPCTKHPRVLKCSAVTASTRQKRIEKAIEAYECDVVVEVTLPCGHNRKMKCHEHAAIEAKQASWPVCNKVSLTPFVYPDCKHLLKCSCHEFERYSNGHAPPCAETVDYTPACKHTTSLACHDRQDYLSQVRNFTCKEKVTVALPRCGHETQVACPIAESLKQWNGESCPTLGLVREGQAYGPKDYCCNRKVTFERSCGHKETVKCERAFELAQNPSRCMEPVVVMNPECGHDCATSCFEADRIAEKIAQRSPPFGEVDLQSNPLEVVQEGDQSNFRSYGLHVQCAHEVVYARTCGHKSRMKCSEARTTTARCTETVHIKSPLCGHMVHLPCHLNPQLTSWQPWPGASPAIALLQTEGVVQDDLTLPGAPPIALKAALKECAGIVQFRRISSCGHEFETKCCDAFKILKGKQPASPCAVRVVKQLPCGHQVTIECSKELDGVECSEMVEKPCWNFAHCESVLTVPCKVSATTIQCETETEWLCSAGHSFPLRVCSKGIPSDCPRCASDRLGDAIEETKRVLEDPKLTGWSPSAAIVREMKGVVNINMRPESKREFLNRKLKLLHRFKEGQSAIHQWSNTLFSPLELPVFAVLSKKAQPSFSDRFDINQFGSIASLNGIEVYEATAENFNRVVGASNACVVFGVLFTAKFLLNPKDIPSRNKGRKGTDNLRKWLTVQSSHGYDAVYRDAKSGKGGGSWIAWHPHALYPVQRINITDANREAVLQCLADEAATVMPPQQIRFEKPEGVASYNRKKQPAAIRAPQGISPEDLETLRAIAGSVSPQFAEMNVWHPWDGKTLSTGASEVIPKKTEKTLASKLNFIPSHCLGGNENAAKTPFGGVKYLKTLQSGGKLKEDGDLFLALEMISVRKQDIAEAQQKVEAYIERLSAGDNYAHPLAIVAIARIASRMSKTPTSRTQQKLLAFFVAYYPDARDWLDGAEAALVDQTLNSASSAPGSIVSSQNSPQDKWEQLKSEHGCQSEAMEELLKLVGLKKVKQAAVNLFRNAMVLQKLSPEQRKKNTMAFNYCFVGNPGTGKTTVARLFAQVMKDSKIRRASTFVECSAQQLKDDGADEFRLKIKKSMGGVLFIDEAYELDPVGDFKGKPIVAELLTAAEDKRGDLSIILAGYEDDIQKKLYAYNDGLPSRFTEVMFEDFDAQDLEVIWDGIAQDRGWEYEKAIAKVACRRLAKAAGRKGFGNARAVRKLFEQAVKEAMARDDFNGALRFQTIDLLGDRPSTNPKLQTVLDEIEERAGWTAIKEEMKKLVRISDENYERELKGQETVEVFYNRLFLGNPGTGKTTCAAYYGRVLKALHFLSNGEVVKKTAGDFVGSHVGESQTKTTQILEMAKGKVLVIDEAYNLNDNMYGKQVLDVLVEKIQGAESDDIAVLLIGYEHEMLEMLRTQNPGLMRRFPPQYAFRFEDYTEHELLDILEWNCARRSVTCPYEVAEALLKQLALQKTQPNFGNAGAVEQLLKHAMGKAVSRPMVDGKTVLTLADVGVDTDAEEKDPLTMLDKLYRMDEIREQLTRLRNEMEVAEREGSARPEVGHFVFRGSPGTGKTTVARVMAQILHDMGVLATTTLVETSGLDLTAQHVGQTKAKVTEKLGEAKGGLLFIDEAYELGKGSFGEEAMTTLVAAMTDPTYAGMVIIIAGYRKDMDQMLDRNAGLKSRFARFIDFPDWEAQDAVVLLSSKADAEDYELESEAVESLQDTFVELKKLDNFGNGRDAVRVWKEMLQCRAQRVVNEPEEERTITGSDAESAGENVLIARRGSGKARKVADADEDPLKLLDGLYRMDKIRDQLSRLQMEMAVAEREGSERPEIGHFVFRGSPGTGKTTVARAMAQILYAMGALATTKLVETSGLDLTGEYLGHTKAKVTDKLVEAKGGLLFIDEAYELGKGMYGEEAMTTLVAAMTDPSYSGMVIVIAGYPADMNVMLDRNAGLKSRFARFIDFPDWEADDGVAFLKARTTRESIRLQPSAEQVIHRLFGQLRQLDGFGNGRDAVRVWKEMLQARAQRVFTTDVQEEERTITKEDAEMAAEVVLAARRPPVAPMLSQSSRLVDLSMCRTQQREPTPAPTELVQEQQEEDAPVEAEEEMETEEAEPEQDVEEEEQKKPASETRDPGVSDEDWEELERAKEAHATHLDELRRAREQAKLEEERRRAEALKLKLEEERRLALAKIEEERRRALAKLEEEKRRAEALQEKIRRICPCPAGFNWYKTSGGWRCGGGSHFVSDAQLNSQFTC